MTRKLIAMRWSRWVATRPPPRARPPSTMRSSPSIAMRDAGGREARRDRREPVALLDPQFMQAAHPRRPRGEGGGDREDRIFVDHRRRAGGRHVDAFERARAHARSATSSPPSTRRSRTSMPAPISISVASRPCAAGSSSRPRPRCRSLERSARRRSGTPPKTDRRGRRRASAAIPAGRRGRSDVPRPRVSTVTSAPKWASIFSVWSREASHSMTVVSPARVEAGEQDGRFDLRRGDGRAVEIGRRIARRP